MLTSPDMAEPPSVVGDQAGLRGKGKRIISAPLGSGHAVPGAGVGQEHGEESSLLAGNAIRRRLRYPQGPRVCTPDLDSEPVDVGVGPTGSEAPDLTSIMLQWHRESGLATKDGTCMEAPLSGGTGAALVAKIRTTSHLDIMVNHVEGGYSATGNVTGISSSSQYPSRKGIGWRRPCPKDYSRSDRNAVRGSCSAFR